MDAMDMNLAVLIAMLVLMVGGALLLNFQIKHSEKKEREANAANVKNAKSTSPEARQATAH